MQGGVRIVKIVTHVPPLSRISFSCAGASVLVASLDSYLYNWGPRSVPPSFSGSWATTEIRKLADVPLSCLLEQVWARRALLVLWFYPA